MKKKFYTLLVSALALLVFTGTTYADSKDVASNAVAVTVSSTTFRLEELTIGNVLSPGDVIAADGRPNNIYLCSKFKTISDYTLDAEIDPNPITLGMGTNTLSYTKYCELVAIVDGKDFYFLSYYKPITSFPLTEDFESNTYLRWSAISYSEENSGFMGKTGEGAKSGEYSWMFISSLEDLVYDQYLISPELAATTGSKNLSFYYLTAHDGEEKEEFRVGYSTTDNAVESFTWFEPETVKSEEEGDWQLYTEENIPANAKYIAIHYLSKDKYFLCVDDITISGNYEQGGETGTYHTITLEVAAGIDITGLTAGKHTVNEDGHLFLQFLPEDRTLTAADILFLIDGIETNFNVAGGDYYYSYILNPVEADHTILIALREYPVILPEVEGIEYNVDAGTHRVAYGEKFTFTLTLADGIDPEKVHVFANGIEIQPDALRSVILSYTIDSVMTPITIVIEGASDPTTGNMQINDTIRLEIVNCQLSIINSGQAVDVNVYSLTGKSVVSLRALRDSKTINLKPGIYLVKVADTVYKVSVN